MRLPTVVPVGTWGFGPPFLGAEWADSTSGFCCRYPMDKLQKGLFGALLFRHHFGAGCLVIINDQNWIS